MKHSAGCNIRFGECNCKFRLYRSLECPECHKGFYTLSNKRIYCSECRPGTQNRSMPDDNRYERV